MQKIKLLFISLIILVIYACSSTPQETVTKFYKSVEEGDISTASSLLTNRFHKAMLDEQKLKDMLIKQHETIKNLNGIKDIKIEGEPGKEIADLKVIISYGNGQSKAEKIKTVLEDGKWKIDISE